jgi:enamine deaminase RidA (YjgF/YER057c/UK114 family)
VIPELLPRTTPEARLRAAGHTLPAPSRPRGAYAPFCRQSLGPGVGTLFTLSGQVCRVDGLALAGVCDAGQPLEDARQAARVAMRNALAVLASACGGALPAVCQVLRLRGFIRATPTFGAHPQVLDAASEVLHIAYPEQPLPARTAVGVGSLPDGAFIEIEVDVVVPEAA